MRPLSPSVGASVDSIDVYQIKCTIAVVENSKRSKWISIFSKGNLAFSDFAATDSEGWLSDALFSRGVLQYTPAVVAPEGTQYCIWNSALPTLLSMLS